jgi:hypothetical protein
MASVNVDASDLNNVLQQINESFQNKEISLRPVAVELVGIMHKRIHTNGLASDNSKIGLYKQSYLQQRERKGLGTGTDVIAVYTRKLSNSWTAFATTDGYAVGFVDQDASGLTALQKLKYIEERFGKKITDLTEDELQYANTRLIELAIEIIQKAQQ